MHLYNKESLNITEFFVTEDAASKIGLVAAKIAYYNFEWRFVTLVLFNTVHAFGLQSFLKNYGQSVIVKLGRFVPKHRIAVPQFVIFGEESSEISSTIRWLVRVKYDSNAKFVILCKSCDENKIFTNLIKNFVVNAILLRISNVNNEPVAYATSILLPGKCGNDVPYKINLMPNCQNDKCFMALFPERLTNFYKCSLHISTIEQHPFMYLHNGSKEPSGTDGDIIKLAADMLNATLILKTPSDGTDMGHYTSNNWTGSLGDIYNNRVHASACSTPITSNKYGNFQISFTYYSMDMVWAAKLPMEKASWEKLLHPLKFHVRIVLLFTFIGIIAMNTFKDTNIWRRVRRSFQFGPSKYNLLFYSWLLFLGMPILRFSNNRSIRISIFTWIWCCFILRCAYQASLINSLKHAAYLDNLESFRDVLKDGYPFGGPASVRDYYHEDREIFDNWIHVELNDLYRILDDILDGKTDFVIASNKELIKHRVMKYNGTKQLQIIPEKIVNSPTVVYFRKYSPLTTPLSYVLRVAVEAGFIERLYQRYFYHDRDVFQRVQTQNPEPLSMYDFAGCFIVLIIGWILSLIYFAVEFICGNLDD